LRNLFGENLLAEESARRIGVLTSGGDCSGLNAVIRAVVHRAVQGYGWRVIGVLDGTLGLLERPLRTEELTLKLFTGNVLRLGGTILGTHTKGDPFDFPVAGGGSEDRSQQFTDGYRELGLSGLIGIGGDGSLKILDRLAQMGEFPFIGIPKTIDNDVPMTEQSVGFSTAVGAAVEALDRLQPTAASHDRVMVP
jgi:6-phosphofructokinase 1